MKIKKPAAYILPDRRPWKVRHRVDIRKREGRQREDKRKRNRDRKEYKRPDAAKRPKTHRGASGSSRKHTVVPFKRRLRSKTKADECKEHADDKGVQRQLKCITGSIHELQCITDKTWLTAKQLEYKYKSEAHTQATDYMHRAKECGLVRINPETGCKEVLYTNSTWIVGATKDAIMTPTGYETSSSAATYVSAQMQ